MTTKTTTGQLFTPEQPDLLDASYEEQVTRKKAQPVECLGRTFPSDQARREHFLGLLREKLKDPEFRKQPGFPVGSDEDILRLSDPPYYTACPNPFLSEFVRVHGTAHDPDTHDYKREPFAADVSEGRAEAIYTAHSYHTKVPPKAIARYILHYTKPGDLVLDAFSGSGMTGVAAAMCGDWNVAREFGGEAGARRAILCDLSPVATFIASNYLNPPDANAFAKAADNLLDKVEKELGSLWHAKDENDELCAIEYQTWAEVMTCPHCQQSVSTVNFIGTTDEVGTAQEFPCPHCQGLVSKAPSKASKASKLERRLRARMDAALGEVINVLPRKPLVAQAVKKGTRCSLMLDEADQQALMALEPTSPHWFPTDRLIDGEQFRVKDCCGNKGVTYIHHFYLPRQLKTYAALWNAATETADPIMRRALMFFVETNGLGMTVLNRYSPNHFSQVNRTLSGTLYIPSMLSECSPRYIYGNKKKKLTKVFGLLRRLVTKEYAVTTQSSTNLSGIPSNSIDYVFVDPPFGRNLQYSELNQIWEAWHRIKTDRAPEAVMDVARKREAPEYTNIMREVFQELFRVLKPERWMTVEFHNSSNVVWLAIQEAILSVGFVIADVRTLDKGGDTYMQTRLGAVKQDLVISAYKPSVALERSFQIAAGTASGVWCFIDEHLAQLPVSVSSEEGVIDVLAERQDYMLFDRMVAFHLQRNASVPLSASEFFAGLEARYRKHDNMYFLTGQEDSYLVKREKAGQVRQFELLPLDESSTIQWLRQRLDKRPSTYPDLHPDFMRLSAGWARHEKPVELIHVLEENFLHYDGTGDVPSQIHAYLSSNYKDYRNKDKGDAELRAKAKDRWYVPDPNKLQDLEAKREKQLLREFDDLIASKEKRIKQPRHEVIRAGFKRAWGLKDYATIKAVAAKVPEEVIQEDQQLLMWYDMAMTRLGDDAF